MKIHRIGLALTVALGCSGRGSPGGGDDDDDPGGPQDDAATPDGPDSPSDGGTPDGCATAPTGDWSGVARQRAEGSGSFDEVRVEVRWTLASTADCVDHYRPSGTVAYVFVSQCSDTVDPPSAPIEPGDGELIIDRTTSPPTYRVTGNSTYDATVTCSGDPPEPIQSVGGVWANARGWFDGAVISGGASDDNSFKIDWRFTRVGTTFTPPAGCSEPSTERWAGTAAISWGSSVHVTWTRVETLGCVDRYTPAGTATEMPANHPNCTSLVREPPTGTVDSTDGVLTIDRSTDPPTFTITGETEWSGRRTCTHADGTTEVHEGMLGGPWAWFRGAFDGDTFGATIGDRNFVYAWSLRRL